MEQEKVVPSGKSNCGTDDCDCKSSSKQKIKTADKPLPPLQSTLPSTEPYDFTPAAKFKRKRQLSPQSLFDETALLNFLTEHNYPLQHANKIWRHLIQGADDINNIPNLPKSLVKLLNEHFTPFTTTINQISTSSDGTTTKLLLQLQDGSMIETVVIRYDRKESPNRKPRTTVCISSQVGCKMACSFCATGTMGFQGHLSAGEIVEQLVRANRIEKITNVVFMGMGEPLDNYESVINAIRAMLDVKRFGLGAQQVCVSTVGVIPRMRQLLKDVPGISLALSLHAPTQELRTQIVPSAKAYPLDKLMKAVDEHLEHNKVMIEYIMLKNVNDRPEQAHILGQLLQGKNVMVNLIPYNPTDVGEPYEAPVADDISAFDGILRNEYKIFTAVRRTMGQDIDGACGQLVVKKTNCASDTKLNNNNKSGAGVTDLEDMFSSTNNTTRKRKTEKSQEQQVAKSVQQTSSKSSPFAMAALYTWVIVLLAVSLVLWYYYDENILQ